MRTLVIGCGYLGQRVAAIWKARGDEVYVLTRSIDRAERFDQQGYLPIVGDVLQSETLKGLPTVDTTLYAVGFDRTATATKRAVYVDGLKNVLDELVGRCGRFIYVSSTSVYGQDSGEFVDESSPTEPREENGRICLDAETLVREGASSTRHSSLVTCPWSAIVLRLAGIYGPARLIARVEQLRSGQPLLGNPQAWLNLIHVDDAAQAVLAAEIRGLPGATYLVSDNRPLHREGFYSAVAEQIGAPVPTFETLAADSVERIRFNKRCVNRRLKEELLVDLRYPTINEGLSSLPELSR